MGASGKLKMKTTHLPSNNSSILGSHSSTSESVSNHEQSEHTIARVCRSIHIFVSPLIDVNHVRQKNNDSGTSHGPFDNIAETRSHTFAKVLGSTGAQNLIEFFFGSFLSKQTHGVRINESIHR